MKFNWAVRLFDTFWFLEQRQQDHLVDPDFIRWVSQQLTHNEAALEAGKGPLIFDDEQALALGKRLRAFLEALRPMLSAIATDTFDEQAALALLKPLIEGVSGRRRLVASSGDMREVIVFEPEHYNGDYVMSELAVSWYTLLFERDRTRLHFCEDPDCGCLFVDSSKNHTKRHCSERCSNRMKARRHRSKL